MEKRKLVQNRRLRQARELRGWTQREVADQIDLLDIRTFRRWESGEASPSLRYRSRLCELFAMSAEELGLMPNVDPQLLKKENQYHSTPPQATTEKRKQPSAFLKGQSGSSRDKWNRHQLLKKVHAFWIKGLLEPSLHETVYLKLELCEYPDAVTTAWAQVIQQPDRPPRPLPSDTHITQVYDDACGELLILGEPGSGKTMLLIELARDLLERASENEAHPIPVIFNLSSWPLRKQPLTTWLVEELNSKYQVPQQVGQRWVENDHILPLLDGLDEVSPTFRKICIEAINAYRQQHGLVPLVVCSRKEEYLDLSTQVLLQQAICIQPLTRQQVEYYLADSGDQLATLQSALYSDADLQKLTTTPLMLSTLAQVYRDRPMEELKGSGSLEMQRRQVFAAYVERMLNRRKPGSRYSIQQSIFWLAYLAQEMTRHYQTELYLERLQFDWLPAPWQQRLCQGLFVGLWAGILVGGLIGLIAVPMEDNLFKALVVAPGLALLSGIFTGIVGALGENILTTPLKRAMAGVIAGVSMGGCIIWVGDLLGWAVNVLAGAAVGAVILLTSLLLNIKSPQIQPTEAASWSWTRVWENFSSSLLVDILIVGSMGITGSFFGWFLPDLGLGIIIILLFGLLSLLIIGFFSGFSNDRLDESLFVKPDEGMYRSGYYALRNGLLAGLLNGLVLTMVDVFVVRFLPNLVIKSDFLLFITLAFTLTITFAVGVHKGGEACIKHVLLRFMLWSRGLTPWNYTRFLDDAAERLLLCKVGGGYIFVHRLLLEYFASLNETL